MPGLPTGSLSPHPIRASGILRSYATLGMNMSALLYAEWRASQAFRLDAPILLIRSANVSVH